MQSIRHIFFSGLLAVSLTGFAGAAMAEAPGDHVLCDALEQARDPLYEVPMGTEDWDRIHAFENAAKALDCAFMINE